MIYIPTIGLEMHCELKTKSKNFSTAKNEYNDTPNSNVKAVDMAFPGTLPVVNKEAVRKSIMMALCLNCTVPDELIFERKNYYYPDLPKGYQITQEKQKPIGINGKLDIEVNGEIKTIFINNIHLEEDTASLEHYNNCSLINYNRAGVPLLECVTEACIHDADTAVSFLEHMRNIYKYTDISDADTKRGQVRCDVNISLAPTGANELGTRVEVKNINSFGNVREAISYEIDRQTKILEDGKEQIVQETRRWDDESKTTIAMRSKADSVDYKFFVEPNIPKIKIDPKWVQEIKNSIPELPLERKTKYIEKYGLNSYDATIIIKDKNIADYFEECLKLGIDSKLAANWLSVQILGVINNKGIEIKDFFFKPSMLKIIIDAMNNGDISSKQAKEIFQKSIEEEKSPKEFISKDNAQISDEDEILKIINSILSNNESQVEAYKNGRTNLFDFFVGQVMKETRGKANPVLTKELLKKELDED